MLHQELRNLSSRHMISYDDILIAFIIWTFLQWLPFNFWFFHKNNDITTRILVLWVHPFGIFVAIVLHNFCNYYEPNIKKKRQLREDVPPSKRYLSILLEEITNQFGDIEERDAINVLERLIIFELNNEKPKNVSMNKRDVLKSSGIFTSCNLFNRAKKVPNCGINDENEECDKKRSFRSMFGNKEDKESDVCAICFEPFANGDLVCQAKNQACSHMFHASCLTTWLVSKEHECMHCPMCRANY